MRLLACLILALGLLNGCSDSTGSDSQDNATTESGACPEDLGAAEGTECSTGGQMCSNGCSDCTPCWILECAYGTGSTWTAIEAHPPPDCEQDPDAGTTDPAPADAAATGAGPTDAISTGD